MSDFKLWVYNNTNLKIKVITNKGKAFILFVVFVGQSWANPVGTEQLFQFDATKSPVDYLIPDSGVRLPEGVLIEKSEADGILVFRSTKGLFWFSPLKDLAFPEGGEVHVRMRTAFGGNFAVLLGAEKTGDPAYMVFLSFDPGTSQLILSKTTMELKQSPGKHKLGSKNTTTSLSGQWFDLKISYREEKAGGVRISAELCDPQSRLLAVVTALDSSEPLPPKGRIGLRAWINPQDGPGQIDIQSIKILKK